MAGWNWTRRGGKLAGVVAVAVAVTVGKRVGAAVAVAGVVRVGVRSIRLTWSGESVGADSRPRTTITTNTVKSIVMVRAMSGRFMIFILIPPEIASLLTMDVI